MKLRTRLLIGLFFVGLLTGAPVPLPGANPQEITVLSFNVGWLRYPLDAQLHPVLNAHDLVPHVAERSAAFTGVLTTFLKGHSADLIVLQEVYELDLAKEMNRFFKAMGYTVLWPHRKDATRMYPAGLFVAVKRLQITQSDFFAFGDEARAGNEKLLDNGVLLASLKDPESGQALQLAALHLQALTVDKTGKATSEEELKAFRKQVEITHNHISKNSKPGLATLAVGDLNVGPILAGRQYRDLLQTLGLASAFFELKPQAKPNSTWDQKNPLVAGGDFSNDPSDMVDHVLFDKATLETNFASVVLNQTLPEKEFPLSDHYGLYVRLSALRQNTN